MTETNDARRNAKHYSTGTSGRRRCAARGITTRTALIWSKATPGAGQGQRLVKFLMERRAAAVRGSISTRVLKPLIELTAVAQSHGWTLDYIGPVGNWWAEDECQPPTTNSPCCTLAKSRLGENCARIIDLVEKKPIRTVVALIDLSTAST